VANDGDVTKNLGRGLVQINLRLAKILEAIEGAGPSSSDAALPLLLDLLDAVERTLGDAHLGPPAPFWVRWLPARVGPDLAGLSLARDQVRDRLEAMGISPVADQGPVDPVLHNVIDTRPTTDESRSGTIAATHQRGWVRRGDPPAVVRHALVTAYARSS